MDYPACFRNIGNNFVAGMAGFGPAKWWIQRPLPYRLATSLCMTALLGYLFYLINCILSLDCFHCLFYYQSIVRLDCLKISVRTIFIIELFNRAGVVAHSVTLAAFSRSVKRVRFTSRANPEKILASIFKRGYLNVFFLFIKLKALYIDFAAVIQFPKHFVCHFVCSSFLYLTLLL